jgi:hypothetical protein
MIPVVYTPNEAFRLHSWCIAPDPEFCGYSTPHRQSGSSGAISLEVLKDCGPRDLNVGEEVNVEVTKALAALQPLYGKDNVEIITVDGQRVRGVVRSMKTTQALTTPSVKIECANGEVIKIPFPSITEIKDHNSVSGEQ